MNQQTLENLAASFAGESQARNKYLAFAKKADDEGYPQIARLFRAVAQAEFIHAQNHFKAMEGIMSTAENLKAAIDGEHFEVTTMYPPYIEEAKAAGEKQAARSMDWAWDVEKGHEVLYTEALECINEPQEEYEYYVCPVCGNTVPRNAPDRCSVCGTPGSRFEKVA